MADTGWVLAGRGRSISRSATAWTNPGNITADDASDATCGTIAKGGSTTDWLVADQFGLSVPAGNYINGIEIQVDIGGTNFDASGGQFASVNVGTDDSTLGSAESGPSFSTTDSLQTMGGASNTFGLSLDISDVNSSDFQVRFYIVNNSASANNATFNVDAVWIKVHYSDEKTITLTSGSSWEVPDDWNSSDNTIEVLGGGGGGASVASGVDESGGGGGGGGYSKSTNVALTAGATITINVGSGGTPNNNGGDTWLNGANLAASSIGAEGGKGGSVGTSGGGLGGQAANGVGDEKYSGGDGGNGNVGGGDSAGGGGGGAAGPLGSGGDGGNGGTGTSNIGGGGGGGANGGDPGGASGTTAGASGGNSGTGGSGGAGGNPGAAGTDGGGGGGGNHDALGGAGGAGTSTWDTIGPGGGGGGGGGGSDDHGGNGGNYGGGGGGGGDDGGGAGGNGGTGGGGLIRIRYKPSTGTVGARAWGFIF